MQCHKPCLETCQQKCHDTAYGYNKPNHGTFHADHTALYGQTTYSTDHNMAKPSTMSHPSYGQTYGQTTAVNPNMSHNSYGTQTYGKDHGHMSAAKPGLGQNYCKDKVHGHGHDHGHAGAQQYNASHGMASFHAGKRREKKMKEKKGDKCKKKDKSVSKKKYKDCNRSCSNSSGSDSD